MKKVCIASFCEWSSFGSVLQALALQRTVRAMGCDVFTVRPGRKPLPQWRWCASGGKNVKRWVMDLHRFLIRERISSGYLRRNAFIEENVQLVHYRDEQDKNGAMPAADIYLAGSDQVWNPLRIRPEFFLEFVPEGKKRFSYAASMGVTKIPPEREGVFADLIRKFDTVSVREEDNAPVISRFTDVPVQVHIDPVFMLDRETWKQYASPYKVDRPYVLVYALYWDKSLNAQLRRLHRETGMDIIAVSDHLQRVYATKRVYDADIGQFLWLIDHAEAVVSSSFHGIALSVIFNKKLVAVNNPQAPSRVACLLERLQVDGMTIAELTGPCKIDYDAVNGKIAEAADAGRAYLREVVHSS